MARPASVPLVSFHSVRISFPHEQPWRQMDIGEWGAWECFGNAAISTNTTAT